ncbi:hypothetical protein KAI92_03705 [Candidatus Parcubacteria bacterium]|nr:hypothetical protein [Candidatus Parcubacteria bacterium]
MDKKFKKIILVIAVLVLLMLLYLIANIKMFVVENEKFLIEENREVEKVIENKIEKISEEDYREIIKKIVFEYDEIIVQIKSGSINNETKEKLIELKKTVESTTVPNLKWKQVHLNIVLSLAKMIDYLESKDDAVYKNSLYLIDKNRSNFDWLDQ